MQKIKYTLNGYGVEMPWNEVNEEIARKEADNREYTVEDEQEDL